MPDWSYHPLLRPLYRSLPSPRARSWVLARLASFGASRAGGRGIVFIGHTTPPATLGASALGRRLRSPIGTGAGLPGSAALAAFSSRLGAGFVEVGPIALAPEGDGPAALPGVDDVAACLAAPGRPRVPVGARLAHAPDASAGEAAAERRVLVERLAPHAAFFTLAPPDLSGEGAWTDAAWAEHVAAVARAAREAGRPLLVGVDASWDAALAERVLAPALAEGVDGALVLGAIPLRARLDAVRRLRARLGRERPILAAGGVVEPGDAIDLLDAGATLVALEEGLAVSGPGLLKRIHEALLHRDAPTPAAERARGAARAAWMGTLLLGLGMIAAGAAAWIVAETRVVLPYDEDFLGMTRDDLAALNPRLLPFLTHDRVTLAGTMVSIGVLYAQVALHAQRHGAHWAKVAVGASATVGFTSFFLFLAFGYFDPLHALVSIALLPFFLWGLRGRADRPPGVPAPDLRNDRAWRRAQWGQLGFVALGGGLVLAGLDIAFVGSTSIFVPSDLEFLQATPDALAAANERLPALVAHDRAGFGGALVSNGLAVLLTALWGVRRGASWTWWTFLAAGSAGFGGAFVAHAGVGYLDAWHLAPALLALGIFVASLAALRPYLARTPV